MPDRTGAATRRSREAGHGRTYRWFVHLDVAKYFPACEPRGHRRRAHRRPPRNLAARAVRHLGEAIMALADLSVDRDTRTRGERWSQSSNSARWLARSNQNSAVDAGADACHAAALSHAASCDAVTSPAAW